VECGGLETGLKGVRIQDSEGIVKIEIKTGTLKSAGFYFQSVLKGSRQSLCHCPVIDWQHRPAR
jgi:hypothetical protein